MNIYSYDDTTIRYKDNILYLYKILEFPKILPPCNFTKGKVREGCVLFVVCLLYFILV